MAHDFPALARERLALCMIVKDEEETLARCLESARPYASELVVVDTGSTDRTAQIARELGAKVVSFPWIDDFSAARNASLEAATKPWALVLDGDEELTVTDARAFARVLLLEGGPVGYSVSLRNLKDDGGFDHGRVFRLFRRDLPGMRYRGELHEQVAAVADGQVTVGGLIDGLEILHHGYLTAFIESRRKAERNTKLAAQLVRSRPDDPFAWYCHGISLADRTGRRESFEKAHTLLASAEKPDAWVASLELRRAEESCLAEDWNSAALIAHEAARQFPRHAEFPLIEGQALVAAERHSEAVAPIRAGLALVSEGHTLEKEPRPLEVEARSLLGLALMATEHWLEAEGQLRAALSKATVKELTPSRALGLLCARSGRFPEARTHFERVLPHASDDESLLRSLGDVLVELGASAEALDLYGRLTSPDAPALIQKAVERLMENAPLEHAIGVLSGWYDLDPDHPDACYWLGLAALKLGDADTARALWTRAIERRVGFTLAEQSLALLSNR